eukprot:66386_1
MVYQDDFPDIGLPEKAFESCLSIADGKWAYKWEQSKNTREMIVRYKGELKAEHKLKLPNIQSVQTFIYCDVSRHIYSNRKNANVYGTDSDIIRARAASRHTHHIMSFDLITSLMSIDTFQC